MDRIRAYYRLCMRCVQACLSGDMLTGYVIRDQPCECCERITETALTKGVILK